MNSTRPAWPGPLPWATLLVAGLALGEFAWARADPALIYERTRILDGEAWRLWTGHLVHFSTSQLLWNLCVFLPTGLWVERLAPARTRLFMLVAPAVIGLVLLAFAPSLDSYAGLSGVVAGLLALLALTRLAEAPSGQWFWWGILILLAAKIVLETFASYPILARYGDPDLRAVPLAHLAGVACAAAMRYPVRNQKRSTG